MSEEFNNKDYGDYFSALEKSIEKQHIPIKKEPTLSRKFFGDVIRIRPWVWVVSLVLVATLVLVAFLPKKVAEQLPQDVQGAENTASNVPEAPKREINFYAEYTADTCEIASDIISQNVIVVNCETNQVVAARNADARCYPASTTKIMTILTAADYITDYDKTFTFSYEITDPFFKQGATIAGFADAEAVNMTDLFYGAILPSGADATVGLALSIAGSETEFAKLMNKKAKELGLKNTHFTNASGLFDENHYTTPEDMAIIVREAMKNDICREALSTYQYTTAATPQHPNGIQLTSTLFSYMYGTEPEGSDILGGKTGFVNESGYCIASFGESDQGTQYVCVTFKGTSHYPAVYDQINLYTRYAK